MLLRRTQNSESAGHPLLSKGGSPCALLQNIVSRPEHKFLTLAHDLFAQMQYSLRLQAEGIGGDIQGVDHSMQGTDDHCVKGILKTALRVSDPNLCSNSSE